MMNIGKAIRELRKQQHLSQSELALAANITQATLSMIENGKRPGETTLKRISNALNVPESLVYVMSIEKDDVPKEKAMIYDSIFPIIQNLVMQIATK